LHRPPTIALTMGDPCGIGPEVILRALGHARLRRRACFLVFGSRAVMRAVARRFGLDDSFLRETVPPGILQGGDTFLVDVAPLPARLAASGKPTAAGGRAAVNCIREAVEAVRLGAAAALVTAPINKTALTLAGERWPGHTELLGHLCSAQPVMMLVGGGLRVALVTTHCAVRDLPRLITKTRVLSTISIVAGELRQSFGIAAGRIAVCGLNPHAGEAGRFGHEEERAITPAIDAARRQGIACIGPLPADVVFYHMLQGRYDAVVAMYHDQANIAVKTLDFTRGVNVTLGLPLVRTSPDHGTAYDIAPLGRADERSLMAAIELALAIAARRGLCQARLHTQRRAR